MPITEMTLGAGRSACDIVLFVGAGLSVKNHIATSEFLLTIPARGRQDMRDAKPRRHGDAIRIENNRLAPVKPRGAAR